MLQQGRFSPARHLIHQLHDRARAPGRLGPVMESGARPARPARPIWMGAMAGLASVVLAVAAGVRRFEVTGMSMAPSLLPGDRLVALRLPAHLPLPVRAQLVRPGAVVAVRDPRGGDRTLIKRVSQLGVPRSDGTAGVVVLGDAADASTDSRTFGPVAPADVVAVAFYRYGPAGRSGALGPATVPEQR